MADQQVLAVLRSSRGAFRFRMRVDGITWRFRFSYNLRIQLWLMDIRQSDDTPIVLGATVVPGVDLFGLFNDARLPPGQLYAIDTSGSGTPPGRHDLRGRVRIAYRPEDDKIAAIDTDDEIL